ncbi:MAG: hypothetical protein ABSH25_14295, partial [Syntrophorhabdales bacterium]
MRNPTGWNRKLRREHEVNPDLLETLSYPRLLFCSDIFGDKLNRGGTLKSFELFYEMGLIVVTLLKSQASKILMGVEIEGSQGFL